MSLVAFTRFPDLAPELRVAIWEHAISDYVRGVVDSLPSQFRLPGGERYDWDDPTSVDVVDCFPILAACREARELAINYFLRLSGPKRRYTYIPPKGQKRSPFHDGTVPIELSFLPRGTQGTSLAAAGTLSIAGGDEFGGPNFRSPGHLVDIVCRYIGDDVENIVFNFKVRSSNQVAMEISAYWPQPTSWVPLSDPKPTLEEDPYAYISVFDVTLGEYEPVVDETISCHAPEGISPVVSVSRDREIRVSIDGRLGLIDELTCHLLRVMDLFDASRDKLPLLTQVDVNYEVTWRPPCDWEEPEGYNWEEFERNEWANVKCVLENDQLFGWFTRNDSWDGWTPPKDQ